MDTASLEKLDLKTIEKASQVLFEQMGLVAKSTGTGSLPGIGETHVLSGRTSNAPFAILQCAIAGARVEVIQLAQIKNAMLKHSLSTAYLVAFGNVSQAARGFASDNKISLIDGVKFIELMENLPVGRRNLIIEALVQNNVPEPEISRKPTKPQEAGAAPSCAKCGAAMRLQVKMKGPYETGKFWQCPNEACGYITAYL